MLKQRVQGNGCGLVRLWSQRSICERVLQLSPAKYLRVLQLPSTTYLPGVSHSEGSCLQRRQLQRTPAMVFPRHR